MSRFLSILTLPLVVLSFQPADAQAGRAIVWIAEKTGWDPSTLSQWTSADLMVWILDLLG